MSFNFGSGSINTGNTNGNNWGHPQVLDDELRFLVQQQRQHQQTSLSKYNWWWWWWLFGNLNTNTTTTAAGSGLFGNSSNNAANSSGTLLAIQQIMPRMQLVPTYLVIRLLHLAVVL